MVLVNEISKILTEKDYNIAARELEETTFLGCSGKENFFRDIILERWVNRKISHFLSQGICGNRVIQMRKNY